MVDVEEEYTVIVLVDTYVEKTVAVVVVVEYIDMTNGESSNARPEERDKGYGKGGEGERPKV